MIHSHTLTYLQINRTMTAHKTTNDNL